MIPESKNQPHSAQNANPTKFAEGQSCCQRCQAPIPRNSDFPEYCDDCYSIYGSCCTEFESDD